MFGWDYHRSDAVSSVHHVRRCMMSACPLIDVNLDCLVKMGSARYFLFLISDL